MQKLILFDEIEIIDNYNILDLKRDKIQNKIEESINKGLKDKKKDKVRKQKKENEKSKESPEDIYGITRELNYLKNILENRSFTSSQGCFAFYSKLSLEDLQNLKTINNQFKDESNLTVPQAKTCDDLINQISSLILLKER